MEMLNKRPLENGYMPKCKPRRVSAIRDFPPGCGPNAMPVSLKSEENVGGEAGALVANVKVECQWNDIVNSSIDVHMAELLDSLVGNITVKANGGVSRSDNSEEKTGDRGQIALKELNRNHHLNLVTKSDMEAKPIYGKEFLMGNSQASTCVWPKDKYRVRKVSAVRDFPSHCGRLVSLPTEEERLVFTAGKTCVHMAIQSEKVPENVTVEWMPLPSRRECLDGPEGKEMTVHSADINDRDRPVHSGLRPFKRQVTLKISDGRAGAVKVSQQKFSQVTSNAVVLASSHYIDGNPDSSSTFKEEKYLEAYDAEGESQITPTSMALPDASDTDSSVFVLKDTVDYSKRKTAKEKASDSVFRSASEVDRKVVNGLMASLNCPWGKGPMVSSNPGAKKNVGEIRKQNSSWRLKAKAVAKKSISIGKTSGLAIQKKLKQVHISDADQNPGALVLAGDEEYNYKDVPAKSSHSRQTRDFKVRLPPFVNSSGDIRDRVKETLRVFNLYCRKLLRREEANSKPEGESKNPKGKLKRIDLEAVKTIKLEGKEVNTGEPILGEVPGVVVGDEFQYRVELAIIGIHRLYQNGIDSMKLKNGVLVATSIVSSGAYTDDLKNADVLVYSGQGGNVVGKQKEQPQDQKLERGNLALKNSIDLQTPVRVIRGWRDKIVDPHVPKPKLVMTYVYDGLYTVQSYWTETGPHGKQVFMFELRRNPGQPELAWKELKKSKQSKSRPGICVKDISGGEERFGICAVNTLDDEKPPRFNYISKMMYPKWHDPIAPPGCDCKGQCSDSKKCKCAARNDGEIPYNHNGALVETKLLVYECGPHCRCSSSCYNRVSQHGIRYQLEIFKTMSRGWGLRALTSIPSGGFICEYAGELLKDTEAEQRIGNDEYLFDIGKNLTESSVNPKDQAISAELLEDGGYTIDACRYGNIGRFINHSCTPNLYAQNVIYDHNDMKMPHIMLFAAENIPPLQELTYHYNYSVNQIHDSDGNIKVKKCYCGTAKCTGRLY